MWNLPDVHSIVWSPTENEPNDQYSCDLYCVDLCPSNQVIIAGSRQIFFSFSKNTRPPVDDNYDVQVAPAHHYQVQEPGHSEHKHKVNKFQKYKCCHPQKEVLTLVCDSKNHIVVHCM